MAEKIEFEFASKFQDLNEMSTMVALTAGASAMDVGINKLDCASEVTRSMTAQSKIKQPAMRLQLLGKFQRGKIQKNLIHRKNTFSWINKNDSTPALTQILEIGKKDNFRSMSSDIQISTAANTKLLPSESKSMANLDYVTSTSIQQMPSKKKIILDKKGRYLKLESKYEQNDQLSADGKKRKKVFTAFGSRAERRSMQLGSYQFNNTPKGLQEDQEIKSVFQLPRFSQMSNSVENIQFAANRQSVQSSEALLSKSQSKNLTQYLQDNQLPSVIDVTTSARKSAQLKKEQNRNKDGSRANSKMQKRKAASVVKQRKPNGKNDSLSDSLLMIQQKMIEKNFHIKQKAINETAPMTGFQSQNLFKLSQEKQLRSKLISQQVVSQNNISRDETTDRGNEKKKPTNVSIELLNETLSEVSECEHKTKEQIIEDWKFHKALNKNERECQTIQELKELQDMKQKDHERKLSAKQQKQMANALKTGFRKVQKIVELKEGLSLQHFIKIGNGVLKPKRQIGDALLQRIKSTAARQGKQNVIYDINKAHAKKLRAQRKVEVREYTVLRSKQAHVDLQPQMDADKNYFLNEFLKLLAFAENYYKQKQYMALYNAAMILAFICIQIRHYALANKVYSFFGQVLMVCKKGPLAINLYKKLRCCAHTDKDAISKMFAYKQMGYTYCQMEKYESAIICFKHQLALAWTIKSSEGELAAYEGLALMYLYIGQIQKCKFYENRISQGLYEPHDSQLYKISISSTLNDNRWLRDKISYGGTKTLLQQAWDKTEDLSRMGTHLTTFFSKSLKDYSLLRPDTIKALQEVTQHFYIAHRDGIHSEMIDPSVQYLETCSKIGTPRFRGTVSAIEDQQEEWNNYVLAQRKNLPSPSAQTNEKTVFTEDKLSMKPATTEKGRLRPHITKQCPQVALHNQKLKRKMDEDFRRLQIQQEKIKTKEQRAVEAKKRSNLDMTDLKARARAHSRAAPTAKVMITHLGRVSKNQKMYENNRQFQLQYDFEGLAGEIARQKDKVFVEPEAFELLNSAQTTSQINQTTKYRYVSRDQHNQRIKKEKEDEKQRVAEIFALQDQKQKDKFKEDERQSMINLQIAINKAAQKENNSQQVK